MDIQQIDAKTFTTIQGGKTFTLRLADGYCHVISHLTANPSAKVFWGCKVFRSVAEVDAKYKAFRGIATLIGA
jgi:hypothetical protein